MLTSPIGNKPSLVRVATLQTNGTKALPGSVRVHMQSFEAAKNVTLCQLAQQMPGCGRLPSLLAELGVRRNFAN